MTIHVDVRHSYIAVSSFVDLRIKVYIPLGHVQSMIGNYRRSANHSTRTDLKFTLIDEIMVTWLKITLILPVYRYIYI